ncbi:MAG: chemotaxis protein CheW [Pseudomonadota bacterium]
MDDLLSEFLTETVESLDVIDVELVKFEQEPNNAEILSNIFRLVHTIKGTCGFLGLPRLEALAHAAETLMGKYRDGDPVTPEGVTLILKTLDCVKGLLALLEQNGVEPEGNDTDLISQLEAISENGGAAAAEPEKPLDVPPLERELKPGEVSLDDLERAFQEAEGPDSIAPKQSKEPSEESSQENVPQVEAPKPEVEASPEASNVALPAAAKTLEPGPDQGPAQNKDGAVKSQTIRVSVEALENLMTMVSELVLTRNQLLEMVRRLEDSEFKVPLQRLSNVTAELQEGVMKTRMQPIGNAWQKLPRIIRDLSRELDKKIELEMIGADTELDRQVLEQIKDPLTHMVRNSADHGLETTADRVKNGKPEIGKVFLRAYHEGGHIIIEIEDDGKGLNSKLIAAKAVEKGLATESEIESMTESQIHKFIFNAGFSTAKTVTSVSGRGVGMDVVRTNIELIGGNVDVKSVEGKGTTFLIKIPLTLAIVSALIVEASKQRFAIPQLSVVELVRAHKEAEHRIEMINSTPVLRLRNKLLPVIYLSRLLNLEIPGEDERNLAEENVFVVVTQVGTQTFGIVVDSVFHTEEIVVKPMSNMLRDITMFSGNTILGDGSVIMIIDPNGIAQKIQTAESSTLAAGDASTNIMMSTDRSTALLVFRAGNKELKAVPLSLVTRLEEIDVNGIERSNDRDLVQYRGTLMPLIYVDENATLKEEGQQPILVFTDEDRSMGLVVDEIVDIVEDQLNVELSTEKAGMVGSAVIKGKATEVIDVGYYLLKAFDDWLANKEIPNVHRQPRLLLVDDSSFFRNMLAPLLGAAGYDVSVAASANEALTLKDNGLVFDIIVSDIEMPDMDGIQFASTIREDAKWGRTPIIALSSQSSPDTIERSRRAGFHDYIAKFDREGLMETLKECKSSLGAAA